MRIIPLPEYHRMVDRDAATSVVWTGDGDPFTRLCVCSASAHGCMRRARSSVRECRRKWRAATIRGPPPSFRPLLEVYAHA
jgi:hypothetical protein